jgi:hypothetical protein
MGMLNLMRMFTPGVGNLSIMEVTLAIHIFVDSCRKINNVVDSK